MASLEEIYQSLGRLEAAQDETNRRLQALETTSIALNAHVNKGKGFVAGLLLAAGGLGAAVSTAVHKLFSGGP